MMPATSSTAGAGGVPIDQTCGEPAGGSDARRRGPERPDRHSGAYPVHRKPRVADRRCRRGPRSIIYHLSSIIAGGSYVVDP
jgi:hypothetical protein